MNWDYEQLSTVAAMLKIFWKFIDSNKGLHNEKCMQMWLALLKGSWKPEYQHTKILPIASHLHC